MKLPIIPSLSTVLALLTLLPAGIASAWTPLRAHPQNPYLLEFRDQPVVLRTFAEHYSAVINSNFDYIPYLDVLKRDGMNLTRSFLVGFQLVDADSATSPLSPTPAAYVQPWKRDSSAGNALDGLGKWDFSQWNENYFIRLNAFAQACSDRGIAIELTLFCVQYTDPQWRTSPFNPANNKQGIGSTNRYDSMRPVNSSLFAAQEAVVRKIVREVNRFDNIYFEIENEPFWNEPGVKDDQEVDFQNRMLAIIRDEESRLPNRHLVAHNFPQQMNAMAAGFDVINEHYPAHVPTTTIAGAEALLRDHYQRGKILALDETDTTNPTQTRLECWMFILGGGGIYNGLDWPNSVYTEQSESGDTAFGRDTRTAIRNLGTYLGNLRLLGLRRNLSWITAGIPTGATLQAMAEPGQQYVAYLHHGRGSVTNFQLSYHPIDAANHTATLSVTLPPGTWRAVWTRPVDLVELSSETFTHAGGARVLKPQIYQADVVLRIDKTTAGANTPPVASPDTGSTAKNTILTQPAPGVLANDSDAQSSPLVAVLNVGPGHGSLVLAANGGFTYTPATGYVGTDSFTYHANDGTSDSNVVTVAITISAAPTTGLVNGGFESGYTGWAWSGNQLIQTTAAGTIPEGVKKVAFNSSEAIPNGVLSQTFPTISGQNYVVSFHVGVIAFNTQEQRLKVDVLGATSTVSALFPVYGQGGGTTQWLVRSLAFKAAGATATLTFRDTSVVTNSLDLLLDNVVLSTDGTPAGPNTPPVASPDTNSTARNSILSHPAPGVLANDSDAESSPLVAVLNSGPSNGSLVLATNGGFTYTPTTGYSGKDSFTYHANDGTSNSNVVTVAITISAVLTTGLVNGGFESGYTGWTWSGNQQIQTTAPGTIPEGVKKVVFNSGNTAPNGVLSQTFSTVSGQNYVVSFHVGVFAFNTQEQRLKVDVLGATSAVSTLIPVYGQGGGTTQWLDRSVAFKAAGATATLTFRDASLGTSALDLLLDNVRIANAAQGLALPLADLALPLALPIALAIPLAIPLAPPSITFVLGAAVISTVAGEPGTYELQMSTNLKTWTVIDTIVLSSPGVLEFTDAETQEPHAFYRIATLPGVRP